MLENVGHSSVTNNQMVILVNDTLYHVVPPNMKNFKAQWPFDVNIQLIWFSLECCCCLPRGSGKTCTYQKLKFGIYWYPVIEKYQKQKPFQNFANIPGGWKKLRNMSRSQARPTPGCIFTTTFHQTEHPRGHQVLSAPSQGPKTASERPWEALRGPKRPWEAPERLWEALRGPSGLQPWRWSPALLPGWLRQQYQMHWGTEADKVSSWKSCKIPKPPMSHKSHLSDKCLLFSTQIQDTCRFKSEFLFSPINIVWLSQSGCETLITLEKTGTQNRAVEALHALFALFEQTELSPLS